MTAIPNTSPVALVLGITGSLGRATAGALAAKGYKIRALTRDPAKAAATGSWSFPIDWRAGNALDAKAVAEAATGAAILFHGVNPPGYAKWREEGIPMLANSIAAAKASGARLMFPGNVYVFGPDAGAVVSESSMQNPVTRKGRIRVEMEAMLRDATSSGVRSVILRAGDFFGPGVESSWFSQAVAKGGWKAKSLQDPSKPGVGHAWAYVPDLAEAFARLALREAELKPFEVFHFGGHWMDPGRTMVEAAHRVIGRPDLPIRRFPWFVLYLGAPFVTFMREAIEMLYLWREPLRLDNTKLDRFLGGEPHTPIDAAIRASLG